MRRIAPLAVAAAAFALTACATKDTYMGLERESAYDKELGAKRLAEGFNNDDYYELMHEGRVLVFADAKNYKSWRKTNEIAKSITKFRAGPNGEQVRFDVTSNESKAMETLQGYKGGAQNLYEGNVPGLSKGFFGFVKRENTYYVFDNWNTLVNFRKSAETMPTGATASGPDGAQVVYVGAASVPADLATRFNGLHDGK